MQSRIVLDIEASADELETRKRDGGIEFVAIADFEVVLYHLQCVECNISDVPDGDVVRIENYRDDTQTRHVAFNDQGLSYIISLESSDGDFGTVLNGKRANNEEFGRQVDQGSCILNEKGLRDFGKGYIQTF